MIVFNVRENRIIVDSSEVETGQEITCNSLGYAIASAVLGISYNDYRNSLKGLSTGNPRKPETKYPLFSIGEDAYKSITQTGPVIR